MEEVRPLPPQCVEVHATIQVFVVIVKRIANGDVTIVGSNQPNGYCVPCSGRWVSHLSVIRCSNGSLHAGLSPSPWQTQCSFGCVAVFFHIGCKPDH